MAERITLDLRPALGTSVVMSMLKREMTYEPEVTSLLVDLFRHASRGLFIDVGSHIGYFPLLLAKYCQVSGARVDLYAHEPLPRLRRISSELRRANGVRFHVDPFAIGDHAGGADFYVSAVSDSSGSLVEGFRRSRHVIRVEVRTLDALYLDKLAQRDVDVFVLMIDIEMGEPAALRGARAILDRHRPLIVCEVLANRTEAQIVDALSGLDYALYRFDGASWHLDDTLVGDRSHRYRDWFFVPRERAHVFGDSFAVPEHVDLHIRLA
jgi:FkbM family methyltransferase